VAEFEDEDGTMSGRAQVKAPHADVRIALQPRGSAHQGHASIQPARPRVEPISNVDSVDEESADQEAGESGRHINREDLEPPASEASDLLSDDTTRARRVALDRSQNSGRSGWNASRGEPKSSSGAKSEANLRQNEAQPGTRSDSPNRSAIE